MVRIARACRAVGRHADPSLAPSGYGYQELFGDRQEARRQDGAGEEDPARQGQRPDQVQGPLLALPLHPRC